MSKIIDFILGRHQDWRVSNKSGHRGEMQRWNGAVWEFRPASNEEIQKELEAAAW